MGVACVWSWCLGLVFWGVGLVGRGGEEGKGRCLREKGRFAAGGVAEEEDGYCWCGVHGQLHIDAFTTYRLQVSAFSRHGLRKPSLGQLEAYTSATVL